MEISDQLATYEGAVAEDMKHSPIPDMDNADFAKVNSDLDSWKVAVAKLRQDVGLPAS